MAKLAPRDLAQVLSGLPIQTDPRIVVGYDTADDAGVFRLDNENLLVQTLDFFTPVADDPLTYGKIAAVNSLNDVFAMGGTPLTALSIVCYPQKGDWSVLGEILKGGQQMMIDEGVAVLGGHSIDDQEIKFGYSVTGLVGKHNVITNAGAVAGDVLILTKPIGTGVISTAVKNGIASKEAEEASVRIMTTTAKKAAEAMRAVGAKGCTDVTGFGLVGHAYEMAKASRVTFEIDSRSVPLLPTVPELVGLKMLTRGDKNNREYVGDALKFDDRVPSEMQSILLDPQTAGGLLISVAEEKAPEILNAVPGSAIIGKVNEKEDVLVSVK
ncbi:MAG: selenide, water dikinase SelD [Acidobacteria bacterium]|nr:MAG: selenide, water dikinase SelD [Acidobacteriota bacterium]REJ98392.1 MAG: selenide, water dikinase SelD [Acidobacteriota bacterium]REK17136.1 MAG: selenide, water dikinase SelD [Acidobacteriota bacterium]REK43046.1 MAG: selenide, water dikinase SelD [Acidobacteriota bacterium]